MDFEAGSKFNYDLGKLFEKYHIRKAVALFHPSGNTANTMEVVYAGEPNLEWILTSFDQVGRELEKRMKAKEYSSFAPPILGEEEKEKIIIPEHN